MLWTDRLIRRGSIHRLLLLSMLMTGLLRGMVLLMPSILTIIAERAMGGVAFSFYTVGLTAFIGEQTHRHETGTVLALYTVTLSSLISIVGSPLSGIAYDQWGARSLYAIALAGYLIGWLCLRLTRPTQAVS